MAGVTCDRYADFPGADKAARGFNAEDFVALAFEAGNFALLNDVDTTLISTACITPGDCIVARGAAAWLSNTTNNREAGVFREIEVRHQFADAVDIEDFRVDTVQTHRVGAANSGVALCVGVEQVHDAALAEHHVVVQVLTQALPQFHRVLVELRVGIQHVIGAHDGCVTAGVTAADVTFLQHRNVFNAMQFGQVVRCREAVATATDDHDIVVFFGLRIAPCARPAAVFIERLFDQGEC